MRWVDRGAEPAELEAIRAEHTQFWVDYYREGLDDHPDEEYKRSLWAPFRNNYLTHRFNGKCGYCESTCDGARGNPKSPTLDHFKPKSKFPRLTYVWGNWIFSCAECNRIKADKWAGGGFVDPCAEDVMERPEEYFDFDFDEYIMDLTPKNGLDNERMRRAEQTIKRLDLNGLDEDRASSEESEYQGTSEMYAARAIRVNTFMQAVLAADESVRQDLIEWFTAPDQEFAGIIKMVANQMRQAGEI